MQTYGQVCGWFNTYFSTLWWVLLLQKSLAEAHCRNALEQGRPLIICLVAQHCLML